MQKQEPAKHKWKVHDVDRPLPPTIKPGPSRKPIPPPSDAIVLFNGKSLSKWQDSKGRPAKWKVEKGYVEVVNKTGSILTKKEFGDCQLHLEWYAPDPPIGKNQGRGNSGVFLMNMYEIQILDCFENKTYADGMTGAVYGQHPPLANACRPPGKWQTYDIIFHRPHFGPDGKVKRAARVTVLFNGIIIQDNVKLTGPTAWKKRPRYQAHADKLPLSLQDHGNPVRFRNIWIREL